MVYLDQHVVELSWLQLEKSQYFPDDSLWKLKIINNNMCFCIKELNTEMFDWLKEVNYSYAYMVADKTKSQHASGIIFIFETKEHAKEFKNKLLLEKISR